MIEALALDGRLFTMDAMHCQKNVPSGPQGKKPSACSG
jgi:predicted transposase YbfD/YdcC